MYPGAMAAETNQSLFSDRSDADRALHFQDELERVSHVISHDLQVPLRAIESACADLQQDHTENNVSRLIEAIQDQSGQLKTELKALVDYIRIETHPMHHAPVEATDLVQSAMQLMADEIQSSGASITMGALPPVEGHRGRLIRLFAYLIDNAIKFRSSATPEIHISAAREHGRIRFCISDNGIGIDEEFHDVIFMLFQRLHAEGGTPGLGIGLALAQKIAESHGGKLTVESAPGKGSRFYFSLPAVERT